MDHVTSELMKGLKNGTSGANIQTDGHGDFMTESAQLGLFSENMTQSSTWVEESVEDKYNKSQQAWW